MSNSDSHGSLVRDEKHDESAEPQPQRPRSKKAVLLGAIAALIVILALALGLGLGLGLKHHHTDSSNNTSGSMNSNSSSNPSNLPLLQRTPPENFILGTIKGQPPQTRSYNFTVGEVWGAPDGVGKRMLVVNGMYPGPTIEANQGDRIVVNVTNTLSTRTAIHWHGLFQNGTNFYDGTTGITECGIPPGQFLVYNFTLGEFSGTTWWHSHYSTQYTDGLTGALIVHPSTPPPPSLPTWDGELSIQMADLYHNFSGELLDAYLSPYGIDGTPGDEPVPDGGTLNGVGQWGGEGDYFNFTLLPQKTYLLRLTNTGSFASLRFSLDHHPLTIIEVDGTFVEPYTVSGVVVAVAQRYGVLVTTNQTQGGGEGGEVGGRYWMRVGVQSDMFTYDQPGQNLDVRGFITYSSSNSSSTSTNSSTTAVGSDNGNEGQNGSGGLPTEKEDPGPGVQGLGDMEVGMLVPATVAKAPERTKEYYVSFDLQNDVNGRFLGFVNGTSWTPLTGTSTLLTVRDAFSPSLSNSSSSSNPSTSSSPSSSNASDNGTGRSGYVEGGSTQPGDQFMITEDSVQVVDLVIDNLDDGDHPFHLHGHRPWIMGTSAGRYQSQPVNNTNPLRRDTVLIPAYSWMVLRFVVDNPGLWAFHCHLAWHMAAGLLMQINALPSKAALLDVPSVIVDQCKVDVPGE